jgi:hypothetical protein
MSAIKNAYIEAVESIGTGNEKTLWTAWRNKYADNKGQTLFGYVDDVYDVISDYKIFAEKNKLDSMATELVLSEAIAALAEGQDPYDIQIRIDERTKVYVDDGHIVIGRLVLEGSI